MNASYVFNLSGVGVSEQCVLDQAKLLADTNKLPVTGYYILLGGLVALLFYFFIQPRLSKNINVSLDHNVGLLGVALVFLSSWVLFLSVFSLSADAINGLSRFSSWLLWPLLLLVVWFVYKRLNKKKVD